MSKFISGFISDDTNHGKELLINIDTIAIASQISSEKDNSVNYKCMQLILNNDREFRVYGNLQDLKTQIGPTNIMNLK